MRNQARRPHRSRPNRNQWGASLIEVLIAVLVLAVGALGVAAMQAMSLRNSQSALERTQAAVASYSILDTMRANRNAASQGLYNLALACTPPDSNGSLPGDDLHRWMTDLQDSVNTDACASVTCNGDSCTIVVQWNDERGTGGSAAQSITTQSRI